MAMTNKALGLSMFTMLAACGQAPDGDASPPPAGEVGSIELALTAVDDAQQQYRLRNASFDVSGYSSDTSRYTHLSLSSEAEPDAELLRTRVLAGNYSVTLANSDWYFERLTDGGYERVAEAVLLGRNYQYVNVEHGASSSVVFRFGVDGDELDFFGGELDIGVTVERNEELAQAGD